MNLICDPDPSETPGHTYKQAQTRDIAQAVMIWQKQQISLGF